MDNSKSSSKPTSPRATLKLKSRARQPQTKSEAPHIDRPQPNSKLRFGAHWSDEYKERMQAEMDELASRAVSEHEVPRR